MVFTDTHTHLYIEAFDNDRDEVIKRALDQNISRFFLPAIDSTYTEAMFQMEQHIRIMSILWPGYIQHM